ncbi:MAG: hypothetical protein F2789_08155 [Actinobacteria bacterium]|nr:hypothetical protein [Actinomycetota bacterium]
MRTAFDHLGEAYIRLAADMSDEQFDLPGLGEWNVRELFAHAIRAYSTAATYLDAAPSSEVILYSAAEYYHTVLNGGPGLHAQVAARGHAAGEEMRDDPVGKVRSTIEAACVRVGLADDDAPVYTPFGQIALIDFLATRVVEAGVHMLDLQRALGLDDDLESTAAEIVVVALVAAGDAHQVIRALTGRGDLPADFNILQ